MTQDPELNITTEQAVASGKLVAVTFRVSHPPYNSGETAGFTVDYARRLVGFGRAVLHDPASLDSGILAQFPRFNQLRESALEDPQEAADGDSEEDALAADDTPELAFGGGDPLAFTVAQVAQWGAEATDHDALEEVLELESDRDDGAAPRVGVTSYLEQRLAALGPPPEPSDD